MTNLTYNRRTRVMEGTYRGVELRADGTAYQFDLYEGGKVVTCRYTGLVDTDGAPLFETVDFPKHTYVPRAATFFDTLANVAAR